jgi:hypothetical protein
VALIEINWDPSRRELRQFAGIWFPAFWAVVGGFVWYHSGELPAAVVLVWAVAAAVSLAGLVNPPWARPVFVAWMKLAYPIAWAVSHLMLAAIYFLVLTPIGLVMRLLGRDPMERRFDRSAQTYWAAHNPCGDTARYFRQS